MTRNMKCLVVSLNEFHKPIMLDNLKTVNLGRSIETKIKDKRCSKNQVELTANYSQFNVQYKHLGLNDGGLNGSNVKKGEAHELFHGDIFELLLGLYPHKIIFQPEPPSPLETADFEKEVPDTESTSPMAKTKQSSNSTKRKSDEPDERESKNNKSCPVTASKENEWESFYNDSLLVYNRNGLKSDKVASYDMDGTLITTVSGRVFAKDINDWRIIYPDVPGKLKQLCKEGYKIVLFTNQAGVASGKTTVSQIQTKIGKVIQKLGVPAQAFVATGKGKYRKPVTGMWDYLVKECNGGVEVDKSKSMYVGDAAGRPEIPKQRKKDHSNADRLFALNLGVPFLTPEEHFLGHKTSAFKLPEFLPSKIDSDSPLYNPASTKVPNHPVEVILLVGFPGSGKSTYVQKHLVKLGYIHANRDSLGTWQKCVAAMEKAIQDGKNVVIDNTNPDVASRERFTQVAKKNNIPIRCFILDISLQQSKHNNKFRELTGSDHSKVGDMIYNMYKSKYVEPTVKEGFSDIVKVNFSPAFKNSDMEDFYKTFLLES